MKDDLFIKKKKKKAKEKKKKKEARTETWNTPIFRRKGEKPSKESEEKAGNEGIRKSGKYTERESKEKVFQEETLIN